MKKPINLVLLLTLLFSVQAFAIFVEDPNTFMTVHFEGTGVNEHRIFWTALSPNATYPEANTGDANDKYFKCDPNVSIVAGKWGYAMDAGHFFTRDVNDYAAEDVNGFSLGVNLNSNELLIGDGNNCMLQFWWKPNFPRPAADANALVRIWQWKNDVTNATFYLEYKYVSNLSPTANAGKEYLNFRAATVVSTGSSTNSSAILAPSIKFDDWNFVTIGWENIASGNDHTCIKINDDSRTNKASSPLRCIHFKKYWQFMNGIFDDIRIVREYRPHWEVQQDYLFGREFTPNPGPRNCADALDMGFGDSRDFNADCKIDFLDFAELAASWIQCVDPVNTLCSKPWL